MNILQLNPLIVVFTPLGPGLAYFIIDYGMSVNTCWVIRLEKGELKHFDSNDVRLEGNPTYGYPIKPELPNNWKDDSPSHDQSFLSELMKGTESKSNGNS